MSNSMFDGGVHIPPLMAHCVAGYPDGEASFTVARALYDGGASFLEIQFPFSDPSADGPSIQEACTVSLAGGFRTDNGFELIRRISSTIPIPIFIMSYANIVYRRGIVRFIKDAAASGAEGVIIPDLPVGSDEGLFHAGRTAGISVIPVITPDITEKRFKAVAGLEPEYIYTAIRSGITGTYTEIEKPLLEFLSRVKGTGARVMAGFGIRTGEQLQILSGHIDIAVAGSVFVDVIRNAVSERPEDLYENVRTEISVICGKKPENISTLQK